MKGKHNILKIIFVIITITCISSQGSSTTLTQIKPYISNDRTVDIISLIEQVNQTTLQTYLETILSFGSRPTGSDACKNVCEYIYNELSAMDGLIVSLQNWTYNTTLYGTNIEATIPGTHTTPLIFLMNSHYDCWPGCPGADDNGAAVAAALTIARILSKYSFNDTIKFIFPSGQEQGLLGTTYYIQNVTTRKDRIAGVINADFIGYATTENNGKKLKLYHNQQSLWLSEFMDETAETYNEYIDLDAIPSGLATFSDQVKYWEYGFNAIFTCEYQFTPYYHTPQDTIENMNITYATKVSKLLIATLAQLAQSNIQIPLLYIDTISGGFGVHTAIENVGNAAATNINWTINLTGKLIVLGRITNGVIPVIEPGESTQIHSRFILGFGRTNITIAADTKTIIGQAFVFLCFIFKPTNTS